MGAFLACSPHDPFLTFLAVRAVQKLIAGWLQQVELAIRPLDPIGVASGRRECSKRPPIDSVGAGVRLCATLT